MPGSFSRSPQTTPDGSVVRDDFKQRIQKNINRPYSAFLIIKEERGQVLTRHWFDLPLNANFFGTFMVHSFLPQIVSKTSVSENANILTLNRPFPDV